MRKSKNKLKKKVVKVPLDRSFLKREMIFGGSLLKSSHPKTKRPIAVKHPMHIVLRSSIAKGKQSFLRKENRESISNIIRKQAKKLNIKLMDLANCGNHLHIMIKIGAGNGIQARKIFQKFIRTITGLIARHVLDIERGKGRSGDTSKSTGTSFWDQRPFTRIIESWTGIKILYDYILQNRLEVLGIIPYVRKKRIAALP